MLAPHGPAPGGRTAPQQGVNDPVGLTVPALAPWYFLGDTLLWISRSGRAERSPTAAR